MLGTGTLNGSGQATFTTSSLSAGSHATIRVRAGSAQIRGSVASAEFSADVLVLMLVLELHR